MKLMTTMSWVIVLREMRSLDQIWSAVSLNWVMDVSGWNMSAGAVVVRWAAG